MAETPQEKRARRLAARDERQRQAEVGRHRARRTRLAIWSGAAVAIAVIAGLAIVMLAQSGGSGLGQPGELLAEEGRNHVQPGTPLSFRTSPPTSGTHYDRWLPRGGVFNELQDPGLWVHNLEHGYVVVLYNCPAACPDLQQQLRDFYEAAPVSREFGYRKLVIAPYQEMPYRLVALAWARREVYEQFDQERLLTFYRAYVDKGPERAG